MCSYIRSALSLAHYQPPTHSRASLRSSCIETTEENVDYTAAIKIPRTHQPRSPKPCCQSVYATVCIFSLSVYTDIKVHSSSPCYPFEIPPPRRSLCVHTLPSTRFILPPTQPHSRRPELFLKIPHIHRPRPPTPLNAALQLPLVLLLVDGSVGGMIAH